MPEPITPPADDTIQDDPIEVTGVPPTLDQVHDISQRHVEDEDEEAAAAAGDGTGDDDAGDGTGDDDGAGGDDAGDGAGDDDGAGDEPVVAPVVPEPAAPVVPEPVAGEPDTDITKNGAGKVAIKDAEGNTFYFNNLGEVPDDFEPASYKALMVGVDALGDKRRADAEAAAKTTQDAAAAEHVKQTEALQQAWDKDVTALVNAGTMPNEPKKLEAAKNEVYDYIEKEMKAGNIITSFAQAFKALQYDKQVAADALKQKELDDAKKQRGGAVQPGGGGGAEGGSSSPRGNRVIEAPPSGVGLDAVHNRAIAGL